MRYWHKITLIFGIISKTSLLFYSQKTLSIVILKCFDFLLHPYYIRKGSTNEQEGISFSEKKQKIQKSFFMETHGKRTFWLKVLICLLLLLYYYFKLSKNTNK